VDIKFARWIAFAVIVASSNLFDELVVVEEVQQLCFPIWLDCGH
jgi:hypothetical protein